MGLATYMPLPRHLPSRLCITCFPLPNCKPHSVINFRFHILRESVCIFLLFCLVRTHVNSTFSLNLLRKYIFTYNCKNRVFSNEWYFSRVVSLLTEFVSVASCRIDGRCRIWRESSSIQRLISCTGGLRSLQTSCGTTSHPKVNNPTSTGGVYRCVEYSTHIRYSVWGTHA